MSVKIDEIRIAALPVCRELKVRRLDAFGTTARGAQTRSSDVDLLVELRDTAVAPAKRFFGILHRLEDSLGCEVDLLTLGSLRNPHFRDRVLKERIPVYEG